MTAFDRTVLMRGISTGQLNSKSEVLKQLENLTAAAEFTTLVEANSLVGDIGVEASKPLIEVFNWRTFIDKGLTVYHTAVVVGNKNVTCFTF